MIHCLYTAICISIHALLAESDRAYQRHFAPDENFYPRSPCGERRVPDHGNSRRLVISIHALLAESDVNTADQEARKRLISIHALLAESDLRVLDGSKSSIISIHALLAESDCY